MVEHYTVVDVADVVSMLASFSACCEPECEAVLVQFASQPTPHESEPVFASIGLPRTTAVRLVCDAGSESGRTRRW